MEGHTRSPRTRSHRDEQLPSSSTTHDSAWHYNDASSVTHTSPAGERVLRGDVVDFSADPRLTDPDHAVRLTRQGALVIGPTGHIAWRGRWSELPRIYAGLCVEDYGSAFILPGFIDAHVHFPQYRMLAAPADDLLDWLNRFTFAEERQYGMEEHALTAADRFLDRLVSHGTTTAAVFSSSHKVATQALFSQASKRGLSLIAGKTMMDCNAPADVVDDAQGGAEDSAGLIGQWHGVGRLRYAITLRFAVTSTEAQLRETGELCKQFPDCLMQTHLSESAGEIELVKQLFPWSKDYTDVYDRFGLLTAGSLFAHGIHLSERELTRLHESDSTIVHCPTSNNFLGSGLFDMNVARDARRPVGVGIATDVGGGTSYSMLQTLGEAYKVAMLKGAKLDAFDAFYLATLGNAERLRLDTKLGNFETGKWADVVVLDPCATPVLEARQELSTCLQESLFALMMLGDDRAVRATYVSGKRVKP